MLYLKKAEFKDFNSGIWVATSRRPKSMLSPLIFRRFQAFIQSTHAASTERL
jgi:hypothetical protein